MSHSATKYLPLAEIEAHSQDVKCVFYHKNLLLSCSRDKTVNVYNGTELIESFNMHSGYVNAVTWLECSQFPEGLIVSAGTDKIIQLYSFGCTEPIFSLIGHTENICSLSTANELIISGSWDNTARVWNLGESKFTLTGHSRAVWSAIILANGMFLTASADKTIKLWQDEKCVKTFTGHTDVVRSVVELGDGFASASNDATIKIWTFESGCIRTLSGHDSYIYSLSKCGEDLLSCGEDRSLKVWRNFECAQSIVLPSISIWSVWASDDKFAVGDNTGKIRIFSSSETDALYAEKLALEISNSSIPAAQVGDLKKQDLPSELPATGREGQVQMINVNGQIEAHQFTEGKWVHLGHVVDAIGSNRKQLFEGKEYDYVFTVDMGDDLMLKLPYNANDNPFTAAQDFIQKNELPPEYLDQVAQFIMKNTQGAEIQAAEAKNFFIVAEANTEGICKKIMELCELDESEKSRLVSMIKDSKFDGELIAKLLQTEQSKVWPVLDYVRFLITQLHLANQFFADQRLVNAMQNLLNGKIENDKVLLMLARFLCNCFATEKGLEFLLQSQHLIFEFLRTKSGKNIPILVNLLNNMKLQWPELAAEIDSLQ